MDAKSALTSKHSPRLAKEALLQLDRTRATDALDKAIATMRDYVRGAPVDREVGAFLDQYFEQAPDLKQSYLAAMTNARESLASADINTVNALGSTILRTVTLSPDATALALPGFGSINILSGNIRTNYFAFPTKERVSTLIHEAVHEGGVWGHEHGSVDPYAVEAIVKKINGWKQIN